MKKRHAGTLRLIKKAVNFLRLTYGKLLFDEEFEKTSKKLILKNNLEVDTLLNKNEIGKEIQSKINRVPVDLKLFIFGKVKEVLSGHKEAVSFQARKNWPTIDHKKGEVMHHDEKK